MATIREYFEADFNYATRVHIKPATDRSDIDGSLFYDFSSFTAFLGCYVPGKANPLTTYFELLERMLPGRSTFSFAGKVTLPSTRTFPGQLEIVNNNPLELRAKFHGDPEWISAAEIQSSTRIFFYSETLLSDQDLASLKTKGKELGLRIQFRSANHATIRSASENPLAFISHDSRDKEEVARKVAFGLQRSMCPVWYDEFSLKVGANLRESIETGLKKCKKCILILSPNFFSNNGWTKKEFDSIFTREILRGERVFLPVWYGVTEDMVYEYSPSLLNVKGLNWNELGEKEVVGRLYNAILGSEA
jgi:hypothetical protein